MMVMRVCCTPLPSLHRTRLTSDDDAGDDGDAGVQTGASRRTLTRSIPSMTSRRRGMRAALGSSGILLAISATAGPRTAPRATPQAHERSFYSASFVEVRLRETGWHRASLSRSVVVVVRAGAAVRGVQPQGRGGRRRADRGPATLPQRFDERGSGGAAARGLARPQDHRRPRSEQCQERAEDGVEGLWDGAGKLP